MTWWAWCLVALAAWVVLSFILGVSLAALFWGENK